MIILSLILIWVSFGGFSWIFEIEMLNQLKEFIQINDLSIQINNLNSLVLEKDILIQQYVNEILDWTNKYNILFEKQQLTQHSLNMANEVLNNLILEGNVDLSSDYE